MLTFNLATVGNSCICNCTLEPNTPLGARSTIFHREAISSSLVVYVVADNVENGVSAVRDEFSRFATAAIRQYCDSAGKFIATEDSFSVET